MFMPRAGHVNRTGWQVFPVAARSMWID